MVRDDLRTPSEVSQTVSDELLMQGIEDLQRCWLKVRLVGDARIVGAGRELVEESKALIEAALVGQPMTPRKEQDRRKAIALERDRMNPVLDSFIMLARK